MIKKLKNWMKMLQIDSEHKMLWYAFFTQEELMKNIKIFYFMWKADDGIFL